MSLQFSMRAIFLALTCTALFVATCTVLPSTVAILLLSVMTLMCASTAIVLAVFLAGRARAFACAAAVPQAVASVYAYERLVECIELIQSNDLLRYPFVMMYSDIRQFMVLLFAMNVVMSLLAVILALIAVSMIKK